MSTITLVPSVNGVPFPPTGSEASRPAPPSAKSYGDGASALSPASRLPMKISMLCPKIRKIPSDPSRRLSRSISIDSSVSVMPGR